LVTPVTRAAQMSLDVGEPTPPVAPTECHHPNGQLVPLPTRDLDPGIKQAWRCDLCGGTLIRLKPPP
jgi:hypothetical protein